MQKWVCFVILSTFIDKYSSIDNIILVVGDQYLISITLLSSTSFCNIPQMIEQEFPMKATEDRNEEGDGWFNQGFVLTSTTNNLWPATYSSTFPSCPPTIVSVNWIGLTLKEYASVIKLRPPPLTLFTVPFLGHFHFIALGGATLLNICECMKYFNSLHIHDEKSVRDEPSNRIICHGRCNRRCNLTVHSLASLRIFITFPVVSRQAVLLAAVCFSSSCTWKLRWYSWEIHIYHM